MSEKEDIRSRLFASDSLTSLRAEQEVVAAFKALPWWSVEHGHYFRDAATEKLRELDVLASRNWSDGSGVEGNSVRLDVLVEVKSMRGYHLIFAPEPNAYNDSRALMAWPGHSRQKFRRYLTDAGFEPTVVDQLVARFTALAYPNEGAMTGNTLLVHPPKTPVFATAFRETNVGSEKDLDASVLWKAIQGLSSVIESSRERWETNFLSNLDVDIQVAREDGRDVAQVIERSFASSLRHFTLFHPAVVVDARLWVSDAGELSEVEQARFYLQDPTRMKSGWFDVVARRSFIQWAEQLTTHYSSHLEHPNEAIWRGNAHWMMEVWDALKNPDLEIEIRARNRKTKVTVQKILRKHEVRRRKGGVVPFPVKPDRF